MANLTERGRMVLGKLLAAEKAGPLPDVDKEILADLKQAAGIYDTNGPSALDFGKAALQSAGEALSAPGRGVRGLGVLAQTGDVHRAAEAVKPGFKPVKGERTGAAVGQLIGEGGFLAAGGTLLKAPKVAGPLYRLARGAAEGAALAGSESAASGASLTDVAKQSAVGAAGGGAGTATAEGLGFVARALGGLIQGQAAAGVGENVLSKVAKSADDLRGSLGSAKNVSKAARSVINRAERSRSAAGKTVGKLRRDMGLPDRRAQALEEFLNGTEQSADELSASIRERVRAGAPKGDPGQALVFLDQLKHDLDKLIGWAKIRSTGGGADKIASLDQGALIQLRGDIKDALSALPIESVKALAKAESVFSKKADAYATLLGSINTEGGAEALLRQLAGGSSERSGLSTGLASGKLANAQRAAKALGLSRVLERGEKQAAANILKTAPRPSGPLQSLLRATGPAGLAKTFSAGRAIEAAGKALPGSKAAVVVGKSLADALKRRRSE